eukprot:7748708-Alexandrium_andersonii.AAC.1
MPRSAALIAPPPALEPSPSRDGAHAALGCSDPGAARAPSQEGRVPGRSEIGVGGLERAEIRSRSGSKLERPASMRRIRASVAEDRECRSGVP